MGLFAGRRSSGRSRSTIRVASHATFSRRLSPACARRPPLLRKPVLPAPPRGLRQGRRREDDGRGHPREARGGCRTDGAPLVSTDGRGDAAALFEKRDAGYREVELAPRLHGLTADFDALLADFVGSVSPVKLLGDRLLAVPAFRFFTRATPGLPDLLLLGKIREIFKRKKSPRATPKVDLIVLDAPATGHALSLVALPRTLLATIPAGPVRKLAEWLDALLSDPKDTALVVVSEPEDFAANETEELIAGASREGRPHDRARRRNRRGRGEGRTCERDRSPRSPLGIARTGSERRQPRACERNDRRRTASRFLDVLPHHLRRKAPRGARGPPKRAARAAPESKDSRPPFAPVPPPLISAPG